MEPKNHLIVIFERSVWKMLAEYDFSDLPIILYRCISKISKNLTKSKNLKKLKNSQKIQKICFGNQQISKNLKKKKNVITFEQNCGVYAWE